MHFNDVKKLTGLFRWHTVELILSNLASGRPLTLFAPSGTGKSLLLRYLAFNRSYRFFHIRAFNTYFVYLDCRFFATENMNMTNVILSGDKANIAKMYKEMVYPQLLETFRLMLAEYRLKSAHSDDLIEFLDNLIKTHPGHRFFLILDGFDILFDDKFETVRVILKFIRDKYRGQIEYIFGMTYEKYLNVESFRHLGELANLAGEKIIYLPIESNTRNIGLTGSQLPLVIYYPYYWLRPGLRKKFQLINKVTGGYAPYMKVLIRLSYNEIADTLSVPLGLELSSRSERLLNSLMPRTNQLLVQIARGADPLSLDPETIARLRKLKIVRKKGITSPILKKFLLDAVPAGYQ